MLIRHRILVHEPHPWWTPELRRQFRDDSAKSDGVAYDVVESPSLSDLRQRLSERFHKLADAACVAPSPSGTVRPVPPRPPVTDRLKKIDQGRDLVCLVLDDTSAGHLQFLSQQLINEPHCVILAIGPPSLNGMEWLLRELGVTDILSDRISGDELATILRRMADHGKP